MKEKVMKGMKMNKALLPLLLCCFIFPASGKDAGWQWYNEKINPKEKENKPVPAAPRQEPDIMQKLTALQTATKRALYEAILYPGVDNFVKYFRLQNYWTQQAGLFTMSAKKAMLAHPELDYNLQYSHYNGTVRNQLAADQAQQRQAIAKLAEHYGIMFFYRGQDPIDGQLAQVINGFRDTYGLSVGLRKFSTFCRAFFPHSCWPRPGPITTTSAHSRLSVRESIVSSCTINSGRAVSSGAMFSLRVSTRTKPAPARSAASPVIRIAPAVP